MKFIFKDYLFINPPPPPAPMFEEEPPHKEIGGLGPGARDVVDLSPGADRAYIFFKINVVYLQKCNNTLKVPIIEQIVTCNQVQISDIRIQRLK